MATYFAGEDEVMPHYISLLNWTDQGIKNVKESPKRADAAMALASKLGAKMQIFYTMGEYDLVSVTEDRKSTRLNSSHITISYAVFCLKKKSATAWHSSPRSG